MNPDSPTDAASSSLKDPAPDSSTLTFEGSEPISTTKDELWAVISDPERLVEFVPGADNVERQSERKYTGDIRRELSHISLSLSGEVELVEMNVPHWIVAEGSVYESKTHSTFDIFAGMEIVERDAETVSLSYRIDIPFTGGVKALSRPIIRGLISSDIDTYFDNIRLAFEQDSDA